MSLRPQIVCGAELFVVRELPARHRTRGVSSCRGSPNGAAHSQIAAKLVQGRSDAAGPVAPNRARNISLHPTLAEGIGAMLATTAGASASARRVDKGHRLHLASTVNTVNLGSSHVERTQFRATRDFVAYMCNVAYCEP